MASRRNTRYIRSQRHLMGSQRRQVFSHSLSHSLSHFFIFLSLLALLALFFSFSLSLSSPHFHRRTFDLIATAGKDGVVRIWRVQRGEGKYTIAKESELPRDPRGPVWRVGTHTHYIYICVCMYIYLYHTHTHTACHTLIHVLLGGERGMRERMKT